MSSRRSVDTPYGPMPGCPDCGVIKLHGEPHICEHGVTSAPTAEIEITMTVEDHDFYRLLGTDE